MVSDVRWPHGHTLLWSHWLTGREARWGHRAIGEVRGGEGEGLRRFCVVKRMCWCVGGSPFDGAHLCLRGMSPDFAIVPCVHQQIFEIAGVVCFAHGGRSGARRSLSDLFDPFYQLAKGKPPDQEVPRWPDAKGPSYREFLGGLRMPRLASGERVG